MKSKLRVVDFFCGAGGFSEGFRQAGFDIIFALDKWQPAVDTHHENHPDSYTICDDIIRISQLPDIAFHSIVPDSEIILGSPPCTFFSNSNRSGNGDKSKGKELIKAYLTIVARKKNRKNSILKYWILENVPKVQSHIKPHYTARSLNLAGNFVLKVKSASSGEYNAKYFGVPSNRIRYFCGDFPSPKKIVDDQKLIPLKAILSNLGNPKEKLHEVISDPLYNFDMAGEDVTDHHYVQELSEFERATILRLKQDKGYMGRMSVPENLEKPARTIMATMSFTSRECFVLGLGSDLLRAPTIREIASLMSFPMDYRFYAPSLGTKYKLVGNAVPPKMSYAFARAIMEAEGLSVQEDYVPIRHLHKTDFKNLNLDDITIKGEREKRPTTRFKYHIPHFKYDTYRVELTNYHSSFEEGLFKWSVEIHYNQGKNKAKIFTPDINTLPVSKEDKLAIDSFIDRMEGDLSSFEDFQGIYCLTLSALRRQKLMGPYELLNRVKKFLEIEFKQSEKDYLPLAQPPYALPKPIVIGYFLMSKCTSRMSKIRSKRFKNIKLLQQKEKKTSRIRKVG